MLIHRRKFLGISAALAGSAALGSFMLPGSVRRASAALVEVPAVDKLDIRVLIDASHDIFQRPAEVAGVKSTPAGNVNGGDYRRVLHNQWGLSLFIESAAGDDQRKILIDFGYSKEALLNNIELLGVDPTGVEAIVISHGHYDHFGGLVGFVETFRDVLADDIKLVAGGEDNFCLRVRGPSEQQITDSGAPDRPALEALNVPIVLAEQPTIVGAHAFTTGAIESRTSEYVLGSGQVYYGKREDGLGCDATAYIDEDQIGEVVKDEHRHEHATSFNVKDRGLVVIGSCSHTGIVNAALQARHVCGVEKVHAIVGGFHLGPAPEDYLRNVIGEIKALDPDVIIPMHCSGANFVEAVRQELPGKLLESSTGNLFSFGA